MLPAVSGPQSLAGKRFIYFSFFIKGRFFPLAIVSVFSSPFNGANAQSHVIDSLNRYIKTGKEDTNKVNALTVLSFTINQLKPDTAILLARQAATLYLFTDGYTDQFGGEKGKKFKYAQLSEKLKMNSEKSIEEQKNILEQTFEEWKGNLEQVDDVLIIGVRV